MGTLYIDHIKDSADIENSDASLGVGLNDARAMRRRDAGMRRERCCFFRFLAGRRDGTEQLLRNSVQ